MNLTILRYINTVKSKKELKLITTTFTPQKVSKVYEVLFILKGLNGVILLVLARISRTHSAQQQSDNGLQKDSLT